MWELAASGSYDTSLRALGLRVTEPAEGRLTGPDSGKGRLPEPADILAVALQMLASRSRQAGTLAGRRVVISAGGTQEPLDPVRFLGNRSSGKQGVALAEAARARGARVTLVAANLAVPEPAGVEVVRVRTAEELRQAMVREAKAAEVVVMTAAVADFRPVDVATSKIKKADDGSAPVVRLERTSDVLAELVGARAPGQVLVGFAAETGDETGSVLDHGRRKLAAKGVDLLVVNDVSEGRAFGTDDNEAVVLAADGAEVHVPRGGKRQVADAVWNQVTPLLT
jgi:phosphopantothenoylcysteine decarboxylase/phosphopantothenate--cysteine ligase